MYPPFISHCDHQMAAKRFGEWFIARGTSVTWSPRSPYLTPPVFLLWGHVKEGTYKREPRDFPKLKTTVTECVRAVTAQGCRRVLVEVRRRVEICLARNGRHSDYLLQFPGRGSVTTHIFSLGSTPPPPLLVPTRLAAWPAPRASGHTLPPRDQTRQVTSRVPGPRPTRLAAWPAPRASGHTLPPRDQTRQVTSRVPGPRPTRLAAWPAPRA